MGRRTTHARARALLKTLARQRRTMKLYIYISDCDIVQVQCTSSSNYIQQRNQIRILYMYATAYHILMTINWTTVQVHHTSSSIYRPTFEVQVHRPKIQL